MGVLTVAAVAAVAGLAGSEAAPPPRPVVDPAALVRQLGDGDYAAREAAARALRGLGPRAGPALAAAGLDPNPEVARRARDLYARVRADALAALAAGFDPVGTADPDHPVWQRYKAVAGDDPPARKLFAAVIADPNRLKLLDRAEAGAAADVYVATAVRMADAAYREHVQKIHRLTVPDAAVVLVLGTYPGAAAAVGEKQEWHERIAVGVSDFADGRAGDLQPALVRLLAAWLTARTRPDQAEAGLRVIADLKAREALPVLRRLAADEAVAPPTRARAVLLVGALGTRDDLPLLRRVADGKVAAVPHARFTVVLTGQGDLDMAWHIVRDGGKLPPDLEERVKAADIRVGDLSVADCGWAAALRLAGGDPAGLGFLWPVTAVGRQVKEITHPGFVGFETPTARAAAHIKARRWLDAKE